MASAGYMFVAWSPLSDTVVSAKEPLGSWVPCPVMCPIAPAAVASPSYRNGLTEALDKCFLEWVRTVPSYDSLLYGYPLAL